MNTPLRDWPGRVRDELRSRLEGPRRVVERPLRFFARIGEHDVSGLAAELAYRFFLALFPLFIFLTALGAYVARAVGIADPSGEILRIFGAALPAEVASLIGEELQRIAERQDAGLLSLGALAALWAATGGTNAIFKGLNRAYGVRESRPFWRVVPLAVALTLAGAFLLVIAAALFVALAVAGAQAAGSVGLGAAWQALVALAVVVGIAFVVAVLYRIGTVVRPPWRAALAGALLFAVAWLGFTYVFALYVNALGDYEATYGALGGVAGLLLWLYTTGFVLLLGAEFTGSLFEPAPPQPPPLASPVPPIPPG